jgi:uncharacterized protein (DUF1499 family)
VAAVLSGLGYRFGWWPLGTAFRILKWSAYVAFAAAALSLAGAIVARPGGRRRGFVGALVGLALAAVTVGWPAVMLYRAEHVPPIHDISTDTSDPPRFVAVLPLRAGTPNSPVYGGAEVAAQQQRAYPQVVPLEMKVPPARAFADALGVARKMGWTIVDTAPAEGRIEATATTLLYGFRDDVVVRVRPTPGGSRVDVRSESRVGKSDLGTNARRIETFLRRLARSS